MRYVSINRLDVCRTTSYTLLRYKAPKTKGGDDRLFQGLVKYSWFIAD
jgi:hypothetical protein